MSIRVMLDTDVLGDLTDHSELLATYSDLIPNEAALTALQKKYPDSEIILIDRGLGDPTGKSSVADVETGAMTVAEAPIWYDRQAKAGVKFLTVYVNRSNLSAVDAAMGSRKHYRWIATLDGTTDIPGFTPLHAPAAVQILPASKLGIHADLSLVMQDGWHPRPKLVPATHLKPLVNRIIGDATTVQKGLHELATKVS